VRDGYTFETYSTMLNKAGFEIAECEGLGSPLLVTLDSWVRAIRNRFGDLAALPVFLLLLPFAAFDRVNPREPVSLYVRAVKRAA
jgi:hypothetical protein